MRELTLAEIELVWGGQAPLGAPSAGEYFSRCMAYTNPTSEWGAAWTIAGVFSRTLGWGGVAWAAGTAAVCGLVTVQYAQ